MAADPNSLEGLTPNDIARLAHVARELLTNPETRVATQQAIRKLDPKANFPELDIQARFDSIQSDFDKKLADRDKAAQEKEAASERRAHLAEAKAVLGDDVTRIDPKTNVAPIEQFMLDNKIADYGAAVRLYAKSQEPAPSSAEPFVVPGAPPTLPKFEMGGDNGLSSARKIAYETFSDLRTGKLKVNEAGVEITSR